MNKTQENKALEKIRNTKDFDERMALITKFLVRKYRVAWKELAKGGKNSEK